MTGRYPLGEAERLMMFGEVNELELAPVVWLYRF